MELKNKELAAQERALYRSHEICEIFKITKRTLADWKKRKVLEPIRVGGLDFYPAADVDALLKRA